MTLQLNEEQTAVKEDGEEDAWEVNFFSFCLHFYPAYASCLHRS